MDFHVKAVSVETDGLTDEQLRQAEVLCGVNAGICQLKGNSLELFDDDVNNAIKRFKFTCNKGHHSIADHIQIEVLFVGVSKIFAMLLNSLQDYATSEKSGRVTEMTGNNPEQEQLYSKWKRIIRNRILEIEPDIDDDMLTRLMKNLGHPDVIIHNGQLDNNSMADYDEVHQKALAEAKKNTLLPSSRLAQENARCTLSIFTKSTTMGYSTSLRQWNYIYDWCIKYTSQFEYIDKLCNMRQNRVLVRKGTSTSASYFEGELYKELKELSDYIKDNLYVEDLRDIKNRCFDFLTSLSSNKNHPMSKYKYPEDDYYGITYSTSYKVSFPCLADILRHRTLKYFIVFDDKSMDREFFIPECIRGTKYEDMWLSDLNEIKDCIPQGTLVKVVETGHVSDFVLKCKERLCSRAQLDVMRVTYDTACKFVNSLKNEGSSEVVKGYISEILDDNGNIKTKCKINGCCKEPCRFADNLKMVFERNI